MNEENRQNDDQPKVIAREARIQPKAAFWVGFSVGLLALVMFSLMFLHAAVRNGWGPFDGI